MLCVGDRTVRGARCRPREGDLAGFVDGDRGTEVNDAGVCHPMPDGRKTWLYSAKNPSQNHRASWTLSKDPGKSRRSVIVLNWASLTGYQRPVVVGAHLPRCGSGSHGAVTKLAILVPAPRP